MPKSRTRKRAAPPSARTTRAVPVAAPAAPPAAVRLLPDVLPPNGAEYPQLLRGETYAWWRSGLGVFFGIALFALLNRLVLQVVVLLGWVTTGSGPTSASRS